MNDCIQNLTERVKTLYQRIQSRSLGPGDTAGEGEVRTPDQREVLKRIYEDKAYHRELLGHMVAPLAVFKHFGAGQTVLDVGAHWGYSAVTMRHVGCPARIISIEAMPYELAHLAGLRELDGPGFTFFNVAASDAEAMITFYTPVLDGQVLTGFSSTGGTLTGDSVHHIVDLARRVPWPREGGEHDFRILVSQVPARRIDSMLGDGKIEVPAVKMDLEGHEAPALRGAARLFREQKPLLMVEAGNRDPAVAQVMTGYGYFHAQPGPDGLLVAHPGRCTTLDGYWIHPAKIELYRSLGILGSR